MKRKLLVLNSYIQALAFLLNGGLIIVLSFCNAYEYMYKAIKISQNTEYEYLRRFTSGWHSEEGTAGWYFIAFAIVLIISVITVLFYRKVYSKTVFRLLSCAFIPLGLADFLPWIIYGLFNYKFSANIDALVSIVLFLTGLVYFIITLVFLIKDIVKIRKDLRMPK